MQEGVHFNLWNNAIEQTQHKQIISKILVSTNEMLKSMLVDGENVLVHCSDGWDRTS